MYVKDGKRWQYLSKMADANFNRKSVKELQKYLKDRGVTFSDL
jgi:hypothetical protein